MARRHCLYAWRSGRRSLVRAWVAGWADGAAAALVKVAGLRLARSFGSRLDGVVATACHSSCSAFAWRGWWCAGIVGCYRALRDFFVELLQRVGAFGAPRKGGVALSEERTLAGEWHLRSEMALPIGRLVQLERFCF